ncbi:hypothetical protein [Lentilactobacillus parabuchneri]|jgi:hypothetical protein|uniref:hypothetical protein n=1 Tax=Lentilactobacillus parabuchneri TaxID=152331 RepID=UPI000A103779|nr:hypothetical protein [Lentilactobacillus parabuchneri]ORM91154.1 hypothetical protein FAM21809_02220 [Lentilactobacillus parabuchneri]ORN13666.1 hypothetical protein FAM23164_02191 [Lentilactobacillus parabuchneri]ORN15436.1 hypothetical protein FAM23165_02231 [Lentilactobacillus parabuchneri]ORN18401.1 hypothetical protein FAM23166_02233 [Lentilactobacillus parabuchneri]ORN23796.1 hypothetical protein FAM23167_02262 [Lentilactobacillus parabuchneri]
MQKMGDTIITDLGMDLLSSVNNGDDKITYTKTVLAADDLTQESDVDIQKTTSLTLIQQTTGTTVISRVDDTVNLGATFTNKEVTQDFDFYVIGWYAKGSAVITDERLFAITPSTVKQTMPAGKDGAATAAISPKYASALSRSATVSLNPDQAGTVTPEYVDQKIQQISSEGIVNAGSTLSESDNLDSFITTGYHLIKGSLPLSAPEGFSTNGQIIVYGNKDTTDGVTQLAYDDINGTSYVRSYNPTNNKWSDWDLVITKSQLNAVLPTDIARTGEDNDFKGKNTFETDPVNKNGDSYGLAKDIATKVTDNGDNSIEINKQAVTPVRDNKNGSINLNSKDMTPADDSAVVHTTGDETIDGQKKFKTDPTDGAGNAYAKTVDVNQQLDKKVNIADMRKPASDVAGIEEVNAKQDKVGYTPADDSKVVHNSGNEEIGGQKTFDTAPIDKTTGNPYITKDGVPSDVARAGQDTNFTGRLQKGGIDVATAADLKSVEESAWYIIPEDDPNNLIRDIGWIKRDPINKYLYILFNFAAIPWVPIKGDTIINLSKYVDSLSDSRGYVMLSSKDWLQTGEQWTLPHNYRVMSTVFASGPNLIVGSGFNSSEPNDGGHYLNLSTFNDNVDQTSWANKTIRVKYNNWVGL